MFITDRALVPFAQIFYYYAQYSVGQSMNFQIFIGSMSGHASYIYSAIGLDHFIVNRKKKVKKRFSACGTKQLKEIAGCAAGDTLVSLDPADNK